MIAAPEMTAESRLAGLHEGPLVALALDPGKTTGYCIGVVDLSGVLILHAGQDQLNLSQMHQFLSMMISCSTNLHVIYEDFSYRQQSREGLDLTPVKMIGIIEMMRERFEPFTLFYLQSAATGKAFWSNDKLKEVGAYTRGVDHGRDATRHLLQWAKFGPGGQWIDLDLCSIQLVDKHWINDYLNEAIL